MKKIIFIFSFAMMFAITASEQFKVNGYGLVGIGTTPTSAISMTVNTLEGKLSRQTVLTIF